MRTLAVVATGAVLAAVAVTSASQAERPSDSLERQFVHKGRIRMDLAAGEYRIAGIRENKIRLEWSVKHPEYLWRVKALAEVHGSDAKIMTDGPSNKGMKVLIQVPSESDLHVRLTAGEMKIGDIRGNKDVELHAGELDIDVGRADDYRRVDASVWAGEVQAAPFNTFKGGLFRSFDWTGKGPYHLHARLKAGEIRLHSKTD